MPRIDFIEEAQDWYSSDQDFAECEGDIMYFRGALVEEAEMERVPKMFISEVSLRAAGIDVSSNENLGLMLESNVNVSNEFNTAAMTDLEMHKIMRIGTSISKWSSSINYEMVQARWGIHPALTKNTVKRTRQQGFRIARPHPLLTKWI